MESFEIVKDYVGGMNLYDVCAKYHIGKLKVKDILKSNGIELRKRGKQACDKSGYIVSDFHIKKYKAEDGFYYVAIDKENGVSYNDYMNEAGLLTTHIKNTYNVEIPSLYDRHIYYMKTGNYWWEQWFDIVKKKKEDTIKCPYCNWESVDIKNKSGAYTSHILSHGISIEEHLNQHPNEAYLFRNQVNLINEKKKMMNDAYYVECPICGKKMKRITLWHLKSKHNMNMKEFRIKYPNIKLNSHMTSLLDKKNFALANLVVSKDRFVSKYEKEIQDFLSSHNINFMPNRQILIGKEIDMLIEDIRIGIEFDGLKWHTEWFGKKDRNYHCNKTNQCNEKGYGLIRIFEDEFVNKKEIVFNKLKHILKLDYNLPKVCGRKVVIKEIYRSDAQVFLEQYHIQGFSSSTVYLGGFYGDELVAVMTFKHGNVKNPNWELTRFTTKPTYYYQGVASKIFTYFVRHYNPKIIVSFADRRWTLNVDNNLYTLLGFELESINKPDYKYYNENVERYKRFHKMSFNKQTLHRKYGFPLTMTETEMAKELGFDRIWDCGLFKFVWMDEDVKNISD